MFRYSFGGNAMRKALLAALLAILLSTTGFAQLPPATVAFGGLRVPPCTVSSDPEYGRVAAKPIQLGGGPSAAGARMARFLGALRGPQGEPLQLASGRGSNIAPAGYWDEPTILDSYTVTYGDQRIGLYVDSYHFSLPKAPVGFTCDGPLVTALGIPPLDPLKVSSATVSLAIELGSSKSMAAVPLDTAVSRGYLMDRFTMIALRAHSSAAGGTPLDPNKPPAGLEPLGLFVLAYPVPCAGRMIAPTNIEVMANQTAVPRNGDLVTGDAVGKRFFGVPTPEGSVAATFRQAPATQVRITYAEACESAPASVLLTLNVQPPRIMAVPGTIPPGISEPDPTVYLQVILDTEGQFVRPLHIGGPKTLVPAAIETIRSWRTEPVRLNGIPVINPTMLQVIFR
jgi:hypothetical protein